jgi:hypothetical protein
LLALGGLLAALACLPASALAWGPSAHRLAINKALDSLPPELRPWFEANRSFLVQHVTDPLTALQRNPSERRNHYIYLDRYGRFPFGGVPHDYKAALAKVGSMKLNQNGLLPWQVGVYSLKLTEAMRAHRWDEARDLAADLAFYVSEAHNPFSTTENWSGTLSHQPGVNLRFDASLVDRYSLFFVIHPNPATFIPDPTEHAFVMVTEAHTWLDNILLADRRARSDLPDYTDEYYDRFYNQAGAVLARQLTDAATDIGSYWFTAWLNAGRPNPPGQ